MDKKFDGNETINIGDDIMILKGNTNGDTRKFNCKFALQKPRITKASNPNGILLANMGHKDNAGFIPMITIAGIIALLGAIVAYIVFAV